MYWHVYMKDKSSVHFIFYIVESSHAHKLCLHAWPTPIHGNSEHVAVRAGARERYRMNRSQDARSWSACSWLLYCSMQRVMFRPCTHLSDHDTWSNQKVTWSNTCPSRDWPYVMSRQNNHISMAIHGQYFNLKRGSGWMNGNWHLQFYWLACG